MRISIRAAIIAVEIAVNTKSMAINVLRFAQGPTILLE